MKKLISILFIILCAMFCMQAMGNIVTVAAPDASSAILSDAREIRIIVTSSPKGLLRSAPAPAVNAWLTGAQIDLTFLRDLGTVTITVANAQETVYSATVTAEEGTQTAISTQNWSAGSLPLLLYAAMGSCLPATLSYRTAALNLKR
jgi:hypothetical protein